MPLTTEQRIELLKKAREAKAKKKEERDALKPTPVKGRPKKETKKTLDLVEATETTEVADEEIEEIIENVEDKIMPSGRNIPKRTTKKISSDTIIEEAEPEVVEQVEVRKIKKPKRRIVRKIIKEEYDSESTEEEIEEVIYKPPKHKSKAKVKEVGEMPREQTPPREPEIRQSKPTLNIFGY
jgi:hypothetical protein